MKESTYFESIEYDVQLDGLLTSDKMVDFARVGKRDQNEDGDNKEK